MPVFEAHSTLLSDRLQLVGNLSPHVLRKLSELHDLFVDVVMFSVFRS